MHSFYIVYVLHVGSCRLPAYPFPLMCLEEEPMRPHVVPPDISVGEVGERAQPDEDATPCFGPFRYVHYALSLL
jgi:hypothetical protein